MALKKEKGNTVYSQIEQLIIEKISNGEYLPETKLPSDRKWASLLNVNTRTVAKALNNLSKKGILIRKKGSGTYIAGYPFSTSKNFEDFSGFPELNWGEKIKLRFCCLDYTPWHQEVWNKLIAEFHKTESDIEVSIEFVRSSEDFYEVAQKFDIFVAYDWQLKRARAFASAIPASIFDSSIDSFSYEIRTLNESLVKNGLRCGIPFQQFVPIFLLNREIIPFETIRIAERGWGWLTFLQEMVNLQRKINRGSINGTYATVLKGHALNSLVNDISQRQENDEDIKYILENLLELFSLSKDGVRFFEDKPYDDLFLSSQIGGIFGTTSTLASFSPFSKKSNIYIGNPPLPYNGYYSASAAFVCPSCYSLNQEKVFIFLKYLISREAQMFLARAKSNIPVLEYAAKSNSYLSEPPLGIINVLTNLRKSRFCSQADSSVQNSSSNSICSELYNLLHKKHSLNNTLKNIRTALVKNVKILEG